MIVILYKWGSYMLKKSISGFLVLTIILVMTVNVQATYDKKHYFDNNSIDGVTIDQFKSENQENDAEKKIDDKKLDNNFSGKTEKKVDKEKYKNDNLIVKLKDFDDVEQLDISQEIVSEYESFDSVAVKVPRGEELDDVKEELENNPIVESVEPEYIAGTSYIPPDPYYQSYQWNLKKVNLEPAWDITKGSSDTIVAIIDTGIGSQNDIYSTLINGCSVIGGVINQDTYPGEFSYDGGAYDSEGKDEYGFYIYPHGTAIASVIASAMNNSGIAGISPNVRIMPVKVFDDGKGYCSMNDVALAIKWASDHGADIINMSLGGPSAPDELSDAVDYAYNKGTVIIGAAGNEGSDEVNYPAKYDNVIAVGSTGSNDGVSSFSNGGIQLDVVAPGENIYTPYIGKHQSQSFLSVSGTSFSSPMIAGVAALIKSKYPSLTNRQISQIIYTSSKDLTSIHGWDSAAGFGRLDAYKAIKLAGNNVIWDNNDKISNAVPLGVTAKISSKLYPASDEDVYKITVSKPGNIKAVVSSSKDYDFVLVLTDKNGNMIDYVDENSGNEREILDTYISRTGTYYLWVTDYYGDFSDNDTYSLEMNPVYSNEIARYAGADKWNTAALISKNGWVNSDNIILANGDNFPDALAGAPLASRLNAPILLTSKNYIPSAVMNEINRLKPKNIYLLGGNLVISDNLESSLRSKGYNVQRLYGADKYKTAVEIGNKILDYSGSDTLVVANGDNFPDALSIGGFAGENGWPILFTNNKVLNSDTKKAINQWDIKKVIIVGGIKVVNESTEKELKNMGLSVERVAGATLWETNVKIVQRFKSSTDGIIVATGNNFPDALSGGAMAFKYSYPILLVKKHVAPSGVVNYLNSSRTDRCILLGGTLAVSDSVQNQIYNHIK